MRSLFASSFNMVEVAVLLCTCNGARFVEQQIDSLIQNSTPFTLHWLDDHSTDDTRQIVRARAQSLGLKLQEWHQPERQFLPGAFFQLLESVAADIYFFCDQDDIWQPGKIDSGVAHLLPDLASPVVCFTDSLMFYDDEPDVVRPLSEVFDCRHPGAQQESRVFMTVIAPGHTQCLTRPLRDLYLEHKSIARAYARNHDAWMYLIASASGSARLLTNVPTALYRQHDDNVTAALLRRGGKRLDRSTLTWKQQQMLRRRTARHAQGFLLAAPTLVQSDKLERIVALARLVATLDQRQSLGTLLRLARGRAMWANRRWAFCFAAACLWSDASA
ncbi:MAG TPA: glycosyltransferase [Steroidobacteraceae bacterium]|nr:glycosyltransferase [Steroidobacteraceae bacterium]